MSITWPAIFCCLGLFGWLAYRSGQFNALYAALIMWMLVTLAGSYALPGMWHLTTALYQPYLYLAVASLVFCRQNWQWQREDRLFAATTHAPQLLHYWAASTLMQHAAYLSLFAIACLYYPRGFYIFALPSLIQLYTLQPVWWIAVQVALMLTLSFTRPHPSAQTFTISSKELQILFLSALVMTVVYVLRDIWFLGS